MRLIIVFFLCMASHVLIAQAIKGVVRDGDTSEPIEGAQVYWEGTGTGVTTSHDGSFTLIRPAEAGILVVAYIGYVPSRLDGDHMPDNIEIELKAISGPSVIIESEIRSQEMNLLNAQKFQTLTEKELCKAACCSLSESFETNASVDASFTDAITGTRQIKMLGLDGRYTQIMFDNIPSVRGLSSIFGLGYLPGPWVREISITKGAGSVAAGYESITGQINVAHKADEMKEGFFINGYAGTQGRFELNAIRRIDVSTRWNSVIMAHGSMSRQRFDMNRDGFLDNPLFYNGIIRNEWKYTGLRGMRGEYAVVYSRHLNTSGQVEYDPKSDLRQTLWGVDTQTDRVDLTAKTGYVFQGEGERSVGSQVNVTWHNQQGNYGLRNYAGRQSSARVNLMYSSEPIASLKTLSGITYQFDQYAESLDSSNFDRREVVPGVYTEVTWNHRDRLSLIGGLRGDWHNVYGFLFTPRFHGRWSLTEKFSIKVSAGKGYRSPNLIMDNVGMLASNRVIRIIPGGAEWPFGLKMEEAWTTGVVVARKFKLWYRDASVSVDLYRTSFVNQIVTDWEVPGEMRFYNLKGESWSNSFQAELQCSPVKRMDARIAWRLLDARTTYSDQLLPRPLVARHRFFLNVAYETRKSERGGKWVFDATAKWLGRQRLPSTFANSHEFMMHSWAPAYWIFNAQIARHFGKQMECYIGCENLGNFMIMNPVISAENPSDPRFDASLVWGPVFGRMGYVGFRMRLVGKEPQNK
jgi:outer membrane receptor for ferrienterochelin and colicins